MRMWAASRGTKAINSPLVGPRAPSTSTSQTLKHFYVLSKTDFIITTGIKSEGFSLTIDNSNMIRFIKSHQFTLATKAVENAYVGSGDETRAFMLTR